MEIPNYDVDIKNKKFKQRFSFMPNDTFRMLICGNSGSGKTNLLYHMLIEPLLYYDEIHLYANFLSEGYLHLRFGGLFSGGLIFGRSYYRNFTITLTAWPFCLLLSV